MGRFLFFFIWLFTGRVENSLEWSKSKWTKKNTIRKKDQERNEVEYYHKLEFFQVLSKICSNKNHFKIHYCWPFVFSGHLVLSLVFQTVFGQPLFLQGSLIFFTGLLSALWAVFNVILYFFYYTRKLTWLAKSVRNSISSKGRKIAWYYRDYREEKMGHHTFSLKFLRQLSIKWLKKLIPYK